MRPTGASSGGVPGQRDEVILGGGCFWCLEAVFLQLKGVERVESGYAGGRAPDPTYPQVCEGTTGHAEVVRIEFNPAEIALRDIFRVFFTVHDPTTPNRQGADVGSQYRSMILYRNPEQKAAADEVVREIEAAEIWKGRVVTEVAPLEAFYPAEEYHRDYYGRNAEQPYCRVVIAPKVAMFRKRFGDRLKSQ